MAQESTKVAKTSTKEDKHHPQSDFFIIEIFKKMLEFNDMKWGIKKKF